MGFQKRNQGLSLTRADVLLQLELPRREPTAITSARSSLGQSLRGLVLLGKIITSVNQIKAGDECQKQFSDCQRTKQFLTLYRLKELLPSEDKVLTIAITIWFTDYNSLCNHLAF